MRIVLTLTQLSENIVFTPDAQLSTQHWKVFLQGCSACNGWMQISFLEGSNQCKVDEYTFVACCTSAILHLHYNNCFSPLGILTIILICRDFNEIITNAIIIENVWIDNCLIPWIHAWYTTRKCKHEIELLDNLQEFLMTIILH